MYSAGENNNGTGSKKKCRKNGFERPYHSQQITTWIILPMLIIQFLIFVSPMLPINVSIPITILYFIIVVFSLYYAYMACSIDPIDLNSKKVFYPNSNEENINDNNNDNNDNSKKTDSGSGNGTRCCIPCPTSITKKANDNNSNNNNNVDDSRHSKKNGLYDRDNDTSDDNMKHCWVCETSVKEKSMHCKYCNKCIENFDHHCHWLNTCLGKANYMYFVKILWSIFWLLLVHTSIMLYIVIDIFLDNGGPTKELANEWMFNSNQAYVVVGFNIFFIVFNLIALFMVIQLLIFHIKLQRNNLTTYQFILDDNAKRRKQAEIKSKLDIARHDAISDAKKANNSFLVIRLQLGKYPIFTLCDPLNKKDVLKEDNDNDNSYNNNNNNNNISSFNFDDTNDDENGGAADDDVEAATGAATITSQEDPIINGRSTSEENGNGDSNSNNNNNDRLEWKTLSDDTEEEENGK